MSGNGQQQKVNSMESQRPVQQVMSMQSQQQIHAAAAENNKSIPGISEQNSEGQSAKMLLFLKNGDQRLITFTLPKESCTVAEILDVLNIPYSDDVHCVHLKGGEVDYVVRMGGQSREPMEEVETYTLYNVDISSNYPLKYVVLPPPPSKQTTSEKLKEPSSKGNPEAAPNPPPKYIDGKIALCKFCGYTGYDFSRCQSCRRIFTEEPKTINLGCQKNDKIKDGEKAHNSNLIEKSICRRIFTEEPKPINLGSQKDDKKEGGEKAHNSNLTEKSIPIKEEIKPDLLKTVKVAKNKMVEKKVGKARKGRKARKGAKARKGGKARKDRKTT